MLEHGIREIRRRERSEELREVTPYVVPVAAHGPHVDAGMGIHDGGDRRWHPHPAVRPEQPVEQIDAESVADAPPMRCVQAGRGRLQDSSLGSHEVVEHFRSGPRVWPWTERQLPRRPARDVRQHLHTLRFEYGEGSHGIAGA